MAQFFSMLEKVMNVDTICKMNPEKNLLEIPDLWFPALIFVNVADKADVKPTDFFIRLSQDCICRMNVLFCGVAHHYTTGLFITYWNYNMHAQHLTGEKKPFIICCSSVSACVCEILYKSGHSSDLVLLISTQSTLPQCMKTVFHSHSVDTGVLHGSIIGPFLLSF